MENLTIESLKSQVEDLLKKRLGDKFVYGVGFREFMNTKSLKIWVACSNVDINQVSGQKPQIVSLRLEFPSLELSPQMWGGNGGQCIYREVDPNNPTEKFLAMKSVKIPFRKPKPELNKVLECLDKFLVKYIETLKQNKNMLRYKNICDYDKILSN